MRKLALLLFLFGLSQSMLDAQPQPGDLFREYIWIPQMIKAESGKFLRVGGKLDYQTNPNHFPPDRHQDGFIPFEQYLELQGAVKAEMVLEKIGSHEDTKDLRISINHHPEISVPDAKGIPAPEADYMHHTYPVTPIPLTFLNQGMENSFKLEVDTAQRWNWPQNLIYGAVLRIYYDKNQLPAPINLGGVVEGQSLDTTVQLGLDDSKHSIRRVDYLGYYDGVNYEGDGIYRQWHYHYLRGKLEHHIGSSFLYPYQVVWNTSWIPDQSKDIQLAAWITFNSGLIYFTPAVTGLTLNRNYHIELCKPYDQPKNWVTRSAEFESRVDISGDPDKIQEARIYWTSWSPCYSNGIYINEVKVFDREGPCYDYMAHEVQLENTSMLKSGTNIIKTGKEPLHDGKMVHGMEVQWPGIMLLIKYSN